MQYALFQYRRSSTGSMLYRVLQTNRRDYFKLWTICHPGDGWLYFKSWALSNKLGSEIFQHLQNELERVEIREVYDLW